MVIDLVTILESRRGLPLAPLQQVLIALRFYATRTIGDLFGVSVFAACTVIHKVSREIANSSIAETLREGTINGILVGYSGYPCRSYLMTAIDEQ